MAMVNISLVRMVVIDNHRVFVKMVVRFAYSYPLIVVMLMVFIVDVFMFMHTRIVEMFVFMESDFFRGRWARINQGV
ncbi:hypothetical protein A6S26_24750 [Nostoc sp. ATCC 43529]|jgi:hypothetical protein|nr:hypothetical protein A6S26_24750 [Nostoc sp. ATCC 43529]